MMVYIRPFSPVGETKSTSNGVVSLDRSGMGTQSVRVFNDGTTTAMVQFLGGPTYTGPIIPIAAGTAETFLFPQRIMTASVSDADGTVYFTTGESN